MLESLKDKYQSVRITKKENNSKVKIENLWEDNSFYLEFDANETDLSFLDDLYFPKELYAIYSVNDNFIEFFGFPSDQDSEQFNRVFKFNYLGHTYECKWGSPSKQCETIFRAFSKDQTKNSNYSEQQYRNIEEFHTYYFLQENKEYEKYFQKLYGNKVPLNFFINGPINKIEKDLILFCKHLNFYKKYYDKNSSIIVILENNKNQCTENSSENQLFDPFPETISATTCDEIALSVILYAYETSEKRLSFLFYYQVLEYYSFYYLKKETQKKLINILKRPDINVEAKKFGLEIFDTFKNHFQHKEDIDRLKKLITDHLEDNDLVKLAEIINIHKEYFSTEVKFEGGLLLDPMVYDGAEIKKLTINDIKTIVSNISKIRNSIVHLRTSNENKGVYPNKINDQKLKPYLIILRKIAEIILIKVSI